MKSDLVNYNQIFLDFDGVISDSNELKSKNILKASLNYLNPTLAIKFVEYFTSNNGIPREKKVYEYFSDNILANEILLSYNELNKNLINAPIIEGVVDFLYEYRDIPIYILSGGDRSEIEEYLFFNSIQQCFQKVLCGPETKEQNLASIHITTPALFIGDSLHDYEVSKKFNLDFIFLFGASQVENYDKIELPDDKKFDNFTSLINYYK